MHALTLFKYYDHINTFIPGKYAEPNDVTEQMSNYNYINTFTRDISIYISLYMYGSTSQQVHHYIQYFLEKDK